MSSGHLPGAGQPLVASRASMAIAHGCQHPSEASWDERTGMGQAGETPWVAGLGAALTALWSLLCQPRAASPGSVCSSRAGLVLPLCPSTLQRLCRMGRAAA